VKSINVALMALVRADTSPSVTGETLKILKTHCRGQPIFLYYLEIKGPIAITRFERQAYIGGY
jgi:hypothetical protein